MKTDIDPEIMDPETYPLWKFLTVALPAVNPTIRVIFKLESAVDYLLQKIFVQYPTTGPAPVTFQDPSFRVVDNSQGRQNDFLVPFQIMSSPGRFDSLGVGNNPPGNQEMTNAMSINWMYWNTSNIELVVSDYVGVGNPGTIDIMVVGRAYFKKDIPR